MGCRRRGLRVPLQRVGVLCARGGDTRVRGEREGAAQPPPGLLPTPCPERAGREAGRGGAGRPLPPGPRGAPLATRPVAAAAAVAGRSAERSGAEPSPVQPSPAQPRRGGGRLVSGERGRGRAPRLRLPGQSRAGKDPAAARGRAGPGRCPPSTRAEGGREWRGGGGVRVRGAGPGRAPVPTGTAARSGTPGGPCPVNFSRSRGAPGARGGGVRPAARAAWVGGFLLCRSILVPHPSISSLGNR